jgi:hypothetical protein
VVDVPRMLVVMAVHAQQFPIAAVGRIEIVIVVAVVHRQFLQSGAGELARAAAAYPRVHLQRPLAIAQFALLGGAPRLGHDAVELRVVDGLAGHGVGPAAGA